MSSIGIIVLLVLIALWVAWGISIMHRKIMISIAHNLSITTDNIAALIKEVQNLQQNIRN